MNEYTDPLIVTCDDMPALEKIPAKSKRICSIVEPFCPVGCPRICLAKCAIDCDCVCSNHPFEDEKLDINVLKEFSGNDTISIRDLYQKFYLLCNQTNGFDSISDIMIQQKNQEIIDVIKSSSPMCTPQRIQSRMLVFNISEQEAKAALQKMDDDMMKLNQLSDLKPQNFIN